MSNISELYPHNRKVFVEALNNLKSNKKLGIVQATGTGKGKLAACFVEHILKRKPSAKILIGAPFNSILQNYRDSFGISSKDVKFVNYASLINLEEKDLLDIGLKYDLLILDEFHKLGAEERNKAINVIFEGVDNPKSICRVIGLTATPVRYLDNARDMGEELFGGNIIEGLSLEDAILDGILPGFIYNACYFGTESMLKEVEDKLKDNEYKISDDTVRNDLMVKVQELNMIYQNRLKIENIIKENTCDLGANQKWVIFCRNKENLAEIREFCKSWFIAEPSIYAIHSDRQAVDNDRVLKEFREVKIGINVMLCVDMLNEGVHIKDLNGVIMLRKTDSPIIFLQQLGRALECGKEFQPIIFDLIGNYRGLKIEEGGLVCNPISIVKGIEEKAEKAAKPNYVIVHNFTEDFDSFITELSKCVSKRVWTSEEDEILKTYYSVGGYKLCQDNGLNRTKSEIVGRANKVFGLVNESRYWTSEDDELLKTYYPVGGYKLCQENGLNKTKASIVIRANTVFGLCNESRHWSPKEFELLKKYYPLGGSLLCIEKGLNRGSRAIMRKAKVLGLKADSFHWSTEDDDILRKYYPEGGSKLCQEKGITRGKEAIVSRASILGLTVTSRSWSIEEDSILWEYYPQGGAQLCIDNGLVNRSLSAVRNRANNLGIKFSSKYWTKEEDDIIRRYYPSGGAQLCIDNGLIKYSASAIMGRANIIGVQRLHESSYKDVDEILLKYYKKGGYKLCQKHGLCKDKQFIFSRASDLGLTRVPNWSSTEEEIIRKYYPMGGSELCIEKGLINRSKLAIKGHANVMGVYRNLNVGWSDDELALLKLYYPIGGSKLCIENGLRNRTYDSIRKKAKSLGLKVIKS